MTIGPRYRDKIGSEIRPKHGDTLIRTALEEEKGSHWTGSGVPVIKEARPTL